MDQRTSRRLGLSRISPRMTPSPQIKRKNESTNPAKITSTANKNNDDEINLLITPTKRQKPSVGRLDCPPKEITARPMEQKQDGKANTIDDIDALRADIQQMNDRLERYAKYSGEKKELEKLIETWKVGGNEAVRQLQAEIQPKQEIETILEHYKLPADIFGSISE